jgi:hypothetical protein
MTILKTVRPSPTETNEMVVSVNATLVYVSGINSPVRNRSYTLSEMDTLEYFVGTCHPAGTRPLQHASQSLRLERRLHVFSMTFGTVSRKTTNL